ncbi:MAG TPA: hypothetical protein VHL59_14165 [Thermoanaerobaculia bacterium]|nr:hypothetical protein [Thermoanaerobaculia bacterium]
MNAPTAWRLIDGSAFLSPAVLAAARENRSGQRMARSQIEDRVLEISEDIAIAANALHDGLTVVSRDTSESGMAKAHALNPWGEVISSPPAECPRLPQPFTLP